MELILTMIPTGDITKDYRIMNSTEGIYGLGQFFAERLMSTHKDADFAFFGQLREFFMWHNATNPARGRQLTQREILIIRCLKVDMDRASTMTAQCEQRLVHPDLAIPHLFRIPRNG